MEVACAGILHQQLIINYYLDVAGIEGPDEERPDEE